MSPVTESLSVLGSRRAVLGKAVWARRRQEGCGSRMWRLTLMRPPQTQAQAMTVPSTAELRLAAAY